MRKNLLIFSFLLVLDSLIASPDSLFNKANSFYQNGQYEEAIESYRSVINAGMESSTLYYNLANAYFRSNKLGEARLFYEKSLKLNPSDEDAQVNIVYLEGLLADRFEEVPVIFYKKWINSMFLFLNSNQWAYASMIFFAVSILSVVIYLLMQNTLLRKTGFYFAILFLVLCILSMTASWKLHNLLKNPETAVVTELSVNVKSAPRETGTGLFVLHEGAKVWLEDKTGGWQEIRLSDGRKGWVPDESIKPI
jgi:tetratricopeptide (TPR) repeat protein